MTYPHRGRLQNLWADEVALFEKTHPRSRELWQAAVPHMPDGVPMLWMAKWPGPWPV